MHLVVTLGVLSMAVAVAVDMRVADSQVAGMVVVEVMEVRLRETRVKEVRVTEVEVSRAAVNRLRTGRDRARPRNYLVNAFQRNESKDWMDGVWMDTCTMNVHSEW